MQRKISYLCLERDRPQVTIGQVEILHHLLEELKLLLKSVIIFLSC